MGSVSSTTKKRAGGVLAVFAIIAAVIIGLATPAFAHHSEIEAGADCANAVTWKATAWGSIPPQSIAQRTNTSVRVWYRVGDVAVPAGKPAAPSSGDVAVSTGAFNTGNGYSFGGTFAFPAGQTTITVFVQEQVAWGSGAGVDTARRVVVTLPTNCPGTPKTSATVECTATGGTITVKLENQGGTQNATFVVKDPTNNALETTKVVAPNASTTVTYQNVPDGTYTVPISVQYGTAPRIDKSIRGLVVKCNGVPKVESSSVCSETGGVVTLVLSNTAPVGSKSVQFVVAGPGTPDGPLTFSVAPGASKTLKFTGVLDPSATYTVTADGVKLADQVLTINCNGVPKVESSSVCSETGGVVTLVLSNTAPVGNKPVQFVVAGPGTPDGPLTFSVAPGASKTLKFTGVADPSATYTVTANGKALADQVLKINCNGVPKVEASAECSATGGVVTLVLSNTAPVGNKPVEFAVDGPGTPNGPETFSVAAGSSKTLKYTGVDDGTAIYKVSADGNAQKDQTFEINCAGVPKVDPSAVCSTTGGVVTLVLSNDAPANYKPVQFVVSGPGTADGPKTVTVAAGSSKTLTFSGVPEGTATYTITADGTSLKDVVLPINCAGVGAASVAKECVSNDGKVTITLTNEGEPGKVLPVQFVVKEGDVVLFEGPVAAGTPKDVVLNGVPDGPHSYTVTADGKALSTLNIDVNCDAPGIPVVSGGVACTALGGDITIALKNDGVDGKNLPVTFRVTDPRDNTFQDVTVDPGQTKNVVLKGFKDGKVTIPVQVVKGLQQLGGAAAAVTPLPASTLDQTLTVACQPPPTTPPTPEVLAVTQTPAAPVTTTAALPYTGGEVLRTLLLGLGLGLVGFALVGVARRRRS